MKCHIPSKSAQTKKLARQRLQKFNMQPLHKAPSTAMFSCQTSNPMQNANGRLLTFIISCPNQRLNAGSHLRWLAVTLFFVSIKTRSCSALPNHPPVLALFSPRWVGCMVSMPQIAVGVQPECDKILLPKQVGPTATFQSSSTEGKYGSGGVETGWAGFLRPKIGNFKYSKTIQRLLSITCTNGSQLKIQ